jgi:hypothetical protein
VALGPLVSRQAGLFLPDERPHFVHVDMVESQAAHRPIHVGLAGSPEFHHQVHNRGSVNASQAGRTAEGVALDQVVKDGDAFLAGKDVSH